jgi:hypothetical protein
MARDLRLLPAPGEKYDGIERRLCEKAQFRRISGYEIFQRD